MRDFIFFFEFDHTTVTFRLWNIPWLIKQLEVWRIVVPFISSICVLYIEGKCSICRFAGRASSKFLFLDRKWAKIVLVSLSGQKSNSEDRRCNIALHSGLFCTFASLRRLTKQPPASFLISVKERRTQTWITSYYCLICKTNQNSLYWINYRVNVRRRF